MKGKISLVIVLALFLSAVSFGMSAEFGGGFEIVDLGPIGPAFATAGGNVAVSVSGPLSLTGQMNLFLPTLNATRTLFMALFGGRYTFEFQGTKPFVGIDGGVTWNLATLEDVLIPIFGFNFGIAVPLFGNFGVYVKQSNRFLLLLVQNSLMALKTYETKVGFSVSF